MTDWPSRFWDKGFGGRSFLTADEWVTYLRRLAVRHTRQDLKKDLCEVCGNPGSDDNPLQLAHRIGFENGVHFLGLTPDYLDRPENLVTAHRRECNYKAEVSLLDALHLLKEWGIEDLPSFIPTQINGLWQELGGEKTRDL